MDNIAHGKCPVIAAKIAPEPFRSNYNLMQYEFGNYSDALPDWNVCQNRYAQLLFTLESIRALKEKDLLKAFFYAGASCHYILAQLPHFAKN